MLRDEADIIVTNPPFSLFRDYFSWVMESGKKFIMIGNKNDYPQSYHQSPEGATDHRQEVERTK